MVGSQKDIDEERGDGGRLEAMPYLTEVWD